MSPANAGCFIADHRGVLMLEQRDGLLNFPGGTAKRGENPRCTAWRETWEEAGLHPEVGELAEVMPNGFHLYFCRIPATSQPSPIDLAEIRRVHWVQPGGVAIERWRFPEQGARLAEWLQRAP